MMHNNLDNMMHNNLDNMMHNNLDNMIIMDEPMIIKDKPTSGLDDKLARMTRKVKPSLADLYKI